MVGKILETIYSTFFVSSFLLTVFVLRILLHLMCICAILCVFVLPYVYLLYLMFICRILCLFVVYYVYLSYLMCICCILFVFVVLLCVFVVPYVYCCSYFRYRTAG